MPWVRLDDGFPEHRKALAAGNDACWLFVAALCYAGRNLTDGFIPDAQVDRLTGQRGARKLADRLVEVGLLDAVDGGFQIHDYSDYQPTKEQVTKTRTGTAERVRKHRRNARGNGVTSVDETPLPHEGAGAGTAGGVVRTENRTTDNDHEIDASAQASGILHPQLGEVVSILEAARGPHGGLMVEPASIDSMLKAHPDRDVVSAAHEVAAMVAEGTNRVSSATSLIGAVLRRRQPSNVGELPQRRQQPKLANSRDLRRFENL